MKLYVLISFGMLSLIFSISSMASTVEEIRFPEVTQCIGPEEWAEMKAVAEEISLPAFAIGGIDRENLPQVLAAGMRRIAISSAVIDSDDPVKAAVQLRRLLG